MKKYNTILFVFLVCILFLSSISSSVIADSTNTSILFKTANKHLENGDLREAIDVYDEILSISPENIDALLMKGIALSNLERHKQSMKELYKVLEKEPDNLSALIGMGVGFGNFGEYKEAKKYFDDAYTIAPENNVVINYRTLAEKTVTKYPYNEVDKPEIFKINLVEEVPLWVKNTAGWWANGKIADAEFLASIQFLIKGNIIKINSVEKQERSANDIPVPLWVKNTAGWWANGKIADAEFLASIQFLIETGLLNVEIPILPMGDEAKKIADRNRWQFERYLDRVEKAVNDDKRYIEYPNPSSDVIKKFLRDYAKWNLDQQIAMGNKSFPDPQFILVDNIYHLEYKVYINKQPHGLPLDHVGTLVNSFKYWEDMSLEANDGKKVKVHFVTTNTRDGANLWVTWVVRDIGQNVLGHANLGKGVIEVALGGYGCDGSFQLFEIDTVETIMTHELGHGIGLMHTTNKESIMYPTIKETNYAYCLLDV